MQVFKYSGTGQRKANQDKVLVHPFDDECILLVLADGMGGYSNGAEAAEVVANAISDFVASHLGDYQPDDLL